MLSVSECAEWVGLDPHELLLGPGPSTKHKALLDSYLLNRWRGKDFVREMICANLRTAIDLGARERAADLLLVLRLFLTDRPTTTCSELLEMTNSMCASSEDKLEEPGDQPDKDTGRRPRLICLSFEARPT
ncbi:MAG: hypothetical protein ACLQIQ_19175 [Beijerinckiaceae bacterium]